MMRSVQYDIVDLKDSNHILNDRIRLLRAEVSRGPFRGPFAVIRYSEYGKEQSQGLRLDLDKAVFIDHFEDEEKETFLQTCLPGVMAAISNSLGDRTRDEMKPAESEDIGSHASVVVTDEVLAKVSRIAASDASVLLQGGSITNRERMAEFIHQRSPRADQPFVSVNAAVIPEELIEAQLFGISEGTIFVDQIHSLSHSNQYKLLRVLMERKIRESAEASRDIDIRILAGTDADLSVAVADGLFREDLFYRLNVIFLDLSLLHRELAAVDSYFDLKISLEEIEKRYISSVLQRSRGQALSLTTGISFNEEIERFETELIKNALQKTSGSLSRTARLLGIKATTLKAKIGRYNLRKEIRPDASPIPDDITADDSP